MTRLQIHEVTDFAEWDAFVKQSNQGTIFSLNSYLQYSERKYKLLWVYKGNQLKAGISLTLADNEMYCELDEFIIYNGILFHTDINQNETNSCLERFKLTEFIINQLDRQYSKIELALSPCFEDARPFLWHNYHSTRKEDKFDLELRYTSYIDISELAQSRPEEDMELFKRMKTLRKRNIREARKKGAVVMVSRETTILVDFYRILMLSQEGVVVKNEKLNRMRRLVDCLLDSKQSVMTLAKNSKGEILYIIVFCFDNKRAYYLFGAGNAEATERYKGTIAFWDTFKLLSKDYGIKEVDLEGVNSPLRGWFKLSFGGDLRPYYHVYKRKTFVQ